MRKILAVATLLFISAITTPAQVRITTATTPYTDSQGNVWQPDATFQSGGCQQDAGPPPTRVIILGPNIVPNATQDQALYRPERWGNTCTYTIPVANGTFNVTLKFSENTFTAVGARVFNVSVNGNQVLTNFDIYKAAGGQFTGNDQIFPTTVSNGKVTIVLTKVTNYAKIDALAVLPATATTAPPSISCMCSTQSSPYNVVLTWVASNSPGVSLYNVYRGTSSGGPYTKINSVTGLTYTDPNLGVGTYYYVVTAVANNLESNYSNQATLVVP